MDQNDQINDELIRLAQSAYTGTGQRLRAYPDDAGVVLRHPDTPYELALYDGAALLDGLTGLAEGRDWEAVQQVLRDTMR